MPWNPPGPRCRHCGKRKAIKARLDLCYVCCDSPAIRALYPSTHPQARRGVGFLKSPPRTPRPTTAAPGTPEKVAVLEARVKRGEAAFHPEDARWEGDTLPILALKGEPPAPQETPLPAPEPQANDGVLDGVANATRPGEKHCPKCDTTKPLSEFHAKRSGRPKLRPQDCHGWCRLCSNEGSRESTRKAYLAQMTLPQVERAIHLTEKKLRRLERRKAALEQGKP